MPTLDQARDWYDPADPVHGLDHVRRVLAMAQRLGEQEKADLHILRAAALLHDVTGAAPTEQDEMGGRTNHELNSAQFARQILLEEGWDEVKIEAVEHCIQSHRYRGQIEPRSLEAKILFDADKLDVIGAFGIARTLGYAIQAGQPIYAPVSDEFIKRGQLKPGEAHSAYHEYLFKLRKVHDRLHTESARRVAARREAILHEFFHQLKEEAEGAI